MGLQWIRVTLRGYGGESSCDDFFSIFGTAVPPDFRAEPSRHNPYLLSWGAALLELFSVDMNELQTFPEPTEVFSERTRQGFERAAEWLHRCATAGLDEWKMEGMKTDVFIGGWLLNEQFDLEIPANFLLECGRLGMAITICTND